MVKVVSAGENGSSFKIEDQVMLSMIYFGFREKLLFRFCSCFFFSVAVYLLVGCSSDSNFEIKGRVKNAGSQTLRFLYYDGFKVNSETATMNDGRFLFRGSSLSPTIVEIQNSGRIVLGHLVISNGETVECELNINDPSDISLKGNDASSELARFVTTNRKAISGNNVSRLNDIVEKYVKENPEKLSSTAIFLLYYDANENEPNAVKLFESINLEARPSSMVTGYASLLERVSKNAIDAQVRSFNFPSSNGKVVHYNASLSKRSMLGFTDKWSRVDTILSAMRSVRKKITDRSHYQMVNVSFDADSSVWKRNTDRDSTGWDNCWAVGAVANPALSHLGIPRLPYFIVVDSAGNQIYRGGSISAATTIISTGF